MQDIIGIIEHERELQKLQREKLKLSLRKQTPGHLIKRRNSYCWRQMIDGQVKEKYLGTDENNTIVRRIKQQKYLTESKKIIDKNLILMDKFLQEYENYDPATVSAKVGRAYQVAPEEVYETMGLINPSTWKDGYTKNDRYPEHLKHTTINGELVRSKSEVIIANQLHLNNISYCYEWREWYGDVELSPDFKLLHPKQHRIILWEHLGMVFDKGYLENAFWKLQKYRECGFVLWDNLIVTFDDANGNIDSRTVSKLIEVYFK